MPNPPPASLKGATGKQRAREGALHGTPARPGAQYVATAAASAAVSASTFTAGNWDAGNWDAGNRQDFEKWLQGLERVETDPQLGRSLMEREPTVSCTRSPFRLQATTSHMARFADAVTGILQVETPFNDVEHLLRVAGLSQYEHAFVEEGGYDDVQYLCGKSFTAVHDVAITCGIKEEHADHLARVATDLQLGRSLVEREHSVICPEAKGGVVYMCTCPFDLNRADGPCPAGEERCIGC